MFKKIVDFIFGGPVPSPVESDPTVETINVVKEKISKQVEAQKNAMLNHQRPDDHDLPILAVNTVSKPTGVVTVKARAEAAKKSNAAKAKASAKKPTKKSAAKKPTSSKKKVAAKKTTS